MALEHVRIQDGAKEQLDLQKLLLMSTMKQLQVVDVLLIKKIQIIKSEIIFVMEKEHARVGDGACKVDIDTSIQIYIF